MSSDEESPAALPRPGRTPAELLQNAHILDPTASAASTSAPPPDRAALTTPGTTTSGSEPAAERAPASSGLLPLLVPPAASIDVDLGTPPSGPSAQPALQTTGLDVLNAAASVIDSPSATPAQTRVNTTPSGPDHTPADLVRGLRDLLEGAVRRPSDGAGNAASGYAPDQLVETIRPYRASLERCFVTGTSLPITSEVAALVQFYLRVTGALGAADPPAASTSLRDTLLLLSPSAAPSRTAQLIDELVGALGTSSSPSDEVVVALAHYRQIRERFGTQRFFERADRTSRMLTWLATLFPSLLMVAGLQQTASAVRAETGDLTTSSPPVDLAQDLLPLAVVEARTLADTVVSLQAQARTGARQLEQAKKDQQAAGRELATVQDQLRAAQKQAASSKTECDQAYEDLAAIVEERDRLRAQLAEAEEMRDKHADLCTQAIADRGEVLQSVLDEKKRYHDLHARLVETKAKRKRDRAKLRETEARAATGSDLNDAQLERLYVNSWRLGRVIGQPEAWYQFLRASSTGSGDGMPPDLTVSLAASPYDTRAGSDPPDMKTLGSYRALAGANPAQASAPSTTTSSSRESAPVGKPSLVEAPTTTSSPTPVPTTSPAPMTAAVVQPAPAATAVVQPAPAATAVVPPAPRIVDLTGDTRITSRSTRTRADAELTPSPKRRKTSRPSTVTPGRGAESATEESSSDLADHGSTRATPSRKSKAEMADALFAQRLQSSYNAGGNGDSVVAAMSASAAAAQAKERASHAADRVPSLAAPRTVKVSASSKQKLGGARVPRPDDPLAVWANMVATVYEFCIRLPDRPTQSEHQRWACNRVPVPFALGAVRSRSSTVSYVDMCERQIAELHGLSTQGYSDQTPYFPNYRPSQNVGALHLRRLLVEGGLDQYLAILARRPWDLMWRKRVVHFFLIDPSQLSVAQARWLIRQLRFQFRWREAFWYVGHWLALSRAGIPVSSRFNELYAARQGLVARLRVAFLDECTQLPDGFTNLVWSEPAIWFVPAHECNWMVGDLSQRSLSDQLDDIDALEPIRAQWSVAPGRFVEALLPEQASRLSETECWEVPLLVGDDIDRFAQTAYVSRDIDRSKYTAGPYGPAPTVAPGSGTSSDESESDSQTSVPSHI